MLGVECAALLPKRAALTPELPDPPDLAPPCSSVHGSAAGCSVPQCCGGLINQAGPGPLTGAIRLFTASAATFLYSAITLSSIILRISALIEETISQFMPSLFLLVGHINKVAIGGPE
jgi:hypothetical protein